MTAMWISCCCEPGGKIFAQARDIPREDFWRAEAKSILTWQNRAKFWSIKVRFLFKTTHYQQLNLAWTKLKFSRHFFLFNLWTIVAYTSVGLCTFSPEKYDWKFAAENGEPQNTDESLRPWNIELRIHIVIYHVINKKLKMTSKN